MASGQTKKTVPNLTFYILHFNLLQSVEGMKVVCHELAQATNDPEGSVMDELVKDADRLVSCLANKVIKITVHLKQFGSSSPFQLSFFII